MLLTNTKLGYSSCIKLLNFTTFKCFFSIHGRHVYFFENMPSVYMGVMYLYRKQLIQFIT
jgi:hypothetical protein